MTLYALDTQSTNNILASLAAAGVLIAIAWQWSEYRNRREEA